MSDLDVGSSRILARGETFIIHGTRRVVWCKVTVPQGLDPVRGAAAAEELGAFLLEHVLERHSVWLGVVFDTRDGPSVLGPVSLRIMERILERAELVRRRVALLLGPTPTLKAQFLAIARERAPHFATVTDDRNTALDWMTSSA